MKAIRDHSFFWHDGVVNNTVKRGRKPSPAFLRVFFRAQATVKIGMALARRSKPLTGSRPEFTVTLLMLGGEKYGDQTLCCFELDRGGPRVDG
jgi:hypothetical protein